jgi:4-hydroxy-tetrahydrodipicolinate reductase
MRIGVFGKGRLGRALAEEAGNELSWQVARESVPDTPVDAGIEASAAAAVAGRVDWALATGSNLLIGTTGWSLPDLKDRVGDRIGVIVAPNFSLTVALYARLSLVLARYAALGEDCDPYLVEHHHARKHDAPSGTAKQLAATLLKGFPRKTEWVIPSVGRPVEPHQLNVSSIRAGHTYSSHIVGLDSPGEVLELHHAARSARPYAAGALVAARWLQGRKGLFTMDQVAAEILDPLFKEIVP